MESLLLSGATAGPSEKPLIDGMYRLRHTVFSERLKWTSLTPDGRERDIYDRLNPVYLICRNPSGDVIGCWRLLPTVGPYMLKDIFAHLLHGHPAPESEDCWEISRFAIDPELRDYDSLGAVGRVVGDMLIELFDFAERGDVETLVGFQASLGEHIAGTSFFMDEGHEDIATFNADDGATGGNPFGKVFGAGVPGFIDGDRHVGGTPRQYTAPRGWVKTGW